MRDYQYDHVHLRSPDPDATARFFETMFGAEVTRGVYPPGTLYPGQQRVTMRLGGQKVLIAAAPARTERLGAAVSPLRAGAYRVDGRRRRCRGGRAASERRRDRNRSGGEVAMGRELQLREAPRTQCSEHEAVTSLTTLSPSNN